MTRSLALLAFTACLGLSACNSQQKADYNPHMGMYRHVVIFKFKDDATRQQVLEIENAFRQLTHEIDTIRAFEWGTNVSPENLADGFTHCFLVTFDSQAGLETYLPHPAHERFVKMLRPHLDKALVVDYVAQP